MRLLIPVFLLASSFGAMAQSVVAIEGEVVAEAEHDRTLISKPSWLRGLHIVGDTPVDSDGPLILAALPADWAQFCGEVTSMSGDYSATVQFVPKESSTAMRQGVLTFSPESDVPLTATYADSGVVLEKGNCFDDRMPGDAGREYSANFWNVANHPTTDENGNVRVVMNMNIARAERIVPLATANGREVEVSCEKLTVPEALAFNYQCTLVLAAADLAGANATEVDFSYTRFYRGRLSEPREAIIHVGMVQDIALGAGQ